MKRLFFLLSILLVSMSFVPGKDNGIMRKETGGMYVVNTTNLCPDVTGYQGATPLEVYIQKGAVVKVVALRNQETPKYFAKVKKELFPLFVGMKASKTTKMKVDGVTGATFSSNAVKANVKAALEYYKKHK